LNCPENCRCKIKTVGVSDKLKNQQRSVEGPSTQAEKGPYEVRVEGPFLTRDGDALRNARIILEALWVRSSFSTESCRCFNLLHRGKKSVKIIFEPIEDKRSHWTDFPNVPFLIKK
jgi:hypothetical protein